MKIDRHTLNRPDAAKLLGVCYNTLQAWDEGSLEPHPMVESAVREALKQSAPVEPAYVLYSSSIKDDPEWASSIVGPMCLEFDGEHAPWPLNMMTLQAFGPDHAKEFIEQAELVGLGDDARRIVG